MSFLTADIDASTLDSLSSWEKYSHTALVKAGDMPLTFKASMNSMKSHNGPCTLLGVILKPGEYDEDSLPFFLLRDQKGDVIQAYDDELRSSDDLAEALDELIRGIASPFALARDMGDYVGPNDLLDSGNDKDKTAFNLAIEALMTNGEAT